MRKADFDRSIRASFNSLFEIGLTDYRLFPNPRSLITNDEFKRIALDSQSTYLDTFLSGSRLKHYNFACEDFSFFQFSHFNSGGKISLRYAFYPNPFSKDLSDLLADDINEEEDETVIDQLIDECETNFDIPPIRFDYEPDSYSEFCHPAAHLHIGHFQNNRWAANKILTPFSFSLLITKHYFPSYWSKSDDNRSSNFTNNLEKKLSDEISINERLGTELFTEHESLLPHLN